MVYRYEDMIDGCGSAYGVRRAVAITRSSSGHTAGWRESWTCARWKTAWPCKVGPTACST